MRERMILAVVITVVLGGAVTAAALGGPDWLEAWSWALAPVGIVIALVTLAPAETRQLLSTARDTIRRHTRAALAVLLPVTVLVLCGGSVPRDPFGAVAGVALMFEGRGTNLVFTRDADGIGYCSRGESGNRDGDSRWRGPNIGGDWPHLDDFTAFASSYGGLEVFGRHGTDLLFGYRNPRLEWQPPQQIGAGVIGKPAAVEDGTPEAGRRFLVFAAGRDGGIRVFERTDYEGRWPPLWSERGTLARHLRDVDRLAVGTDRAGRLVLLVRSNGRLLEMHRGEHPVAADVSRGWSRPRPLLLAGGSSVTAAGDLTFAAIDDISVARALHFAVATPTGIALLSTRDITGRWSVRTVELGFTPAAVAWLDAAGRRGTRTNLIIFVRDGVPWYVRPGAQPKPLRC